MSHETEDINFITYKKFWDKIVEDSKIKNLPIDILFLYCDSKISEEYILDGNKIISKCEENYWYSLLLKVLNGLDYSNVNNYDLTFKTNLSTIINLDRFYDYCNQIKDRKYVYDGIFGQYNDFNFCSGAGTLLDNECVKIILNNKNLSNSEWTDDIFIGHVLNKLNNIKPNIGNMSRYDIINQNQNIEEHKILNSTHIRIKIRVSDCDSIMTEKVYKILSK
jgi:hypothetical protein